MAKNSFFSLSIIEQYHLKRCQRLSGPEAVWTAFASHSFAARDIWYSHPFDSVHIERQSPAFAHVAIISALQGLTSIDIPLRSHITRYVVCNRQTVRCHFTSYRHTFGDWVFVAVDHYHVQTAILHANHHLSWSQRNCITQTVSSSDIYGVSCDRLVGRWTSVDIDVAVIRPAITRRIATGQIVVGSPCFTIRPDHWRMQRVYSRLLPTANTIITVPATKFSVDKASTSANANVDDAQVCAHSPLSNGVNDRSLSASPLPVTKCTDVVSSTARHASLPRLADGHGSIIR